MLFCVFCIVDSLYTEILLMLNCGLGETRNGIISLSNYRLYVTTSPGFLNIPLGLIEQVRHVPHLKGLCYEIDFENVDEN